MAHRRGRVGVGKSKAQFGKKAEEIKANSVASAIETIEKLEVKLTEFAKKHRSDIKNDPAFRMKFLEMCGPLGVDPLSSEKGFWGNILGMGEFYYELAVKVAEVCIASRTRNGGIISVAEVRNILLSRGTKFKFLSTVSNNSSNKSKGAAYTEHDIITSIQKLSQLGSGFRTITIGKNIMIVSVPMELDNDHLQVMNIAQEEQENDINDCHGRVTKIQIKSATQWSDERIQRSIELLLRQGMAWLDVYDGIDSYWFPSLWKQGMELE